MTFDNNVLNRVRFSRVEQLEVSLHLRRLLTFAVYIYNVDKNVYFCF